MAIAPTSLIAPQIGSKIFSLTHCPTFFSALIMPWKMPNTIFLPGSSIVLAGEAIPNAALNPLINGWKIFSTIHTPIFVNPTMIPRRIPPTISPPQASICSLKNSPMPLNASPIFSPIAFPSPVIKPTAAPNALPRNSDALFANPE